MGIFYDLVITAMWMTVYLGIVVSITWVISQITKRKRRNLVPAWDITKGHRWSFPALNLSPSICNVCEREVMGGSCCDSCGICSCLKCMREADKAHPCKALSWEGGSFKHHWIKGNIVKEVAVCEVCEESCVRHPEHLTDFRCCWCQRTVHTDCLPNIAEICDLGRWRDFIVPPNCVTVKSVGWKGRSSLAVKEVKIPVNATDWSPLIVIANRKSGNNDGEAILQNFRGALNPAQVIDLAELPPESALEWCRLVPDVVCRVLVAGGDGTIAWVLKAVDDLQLPTQPSVAVIPLGTGNDFSRVLGWGEGHSGAVNVREILHKLEKAKVVKMDRWMITVTHATNLPMNLRSTIARLASKEVIMNNYASVGVDALVALKFHRTRESKLYVFGSRMINKILFLLFGTKEFFDRDCHGIHRHLELYLDGEKVDLPEIESIIILNIPCWGAGVRLWTMRQGSDYVPNQTIDDGRVEVVGLYSTFHIAQLQMGLSEAVRFGQAKTVKIRVKRVMPMQVDGEPWEQLPCDIDLAYHNQASMLAYSSSVIRPLNSPQT